MTGRVARWLAATAVLAWLATPYVYDQLDDQFITLAYAYRWVETGALEWASGERVEGYSNFAWLVFGAVVAALGGDAAAWGKVASFGAAAGVIGLASSLGPADRRGIVAPLAFALWAPFAYWSVVALETMAFAGLLAAGWTALCTDRRLAASGGLAVAALTRPEGLGYLGLATAVVLARPRRPEDRLALVPVGLVAAYHVARVAWFGALWPTPFLVKIQAMDAGLVGLQQWSSDVLAGAGLLVLAFAAHRPGTWLVAVPFVVQSALLVRADGDWMGMSRFVLPGLVATTLAAMASGTARTAPWFAFASFAAVFGGVWETHWPKGRMCRARELAPLADPLGNLRRPWLTPFHEDVRFVVENLPDGTVLETADVGLTGNVPGLVVRDIVGLVDREIAELWATGERDPYGLPRYQPGGELDCIRVIHYNRGHVPLDGRVAPTFPVVREVRYGAFVAGYHCKSGDVPPVETVLARWDTLIARYPSQAFLHAARAEAVRHSSFVGAPFPWHDGRGFGLYDDRTLVSRAWSASAARDYVLHLDADEPFGEGARVQVDTEPPCGAGPVEHVVTGPVRVPLPRACGPTVAYAVRFTNDRNDAPGRDRNVYVSIGPR